MARCGKLKPFHNEIIEKNKSGIGYKTLAKMYGCSKSAIEWIVRSRSDNPGPYKLRTKEYKKNPIIEQSVQHQLNQLMRERKFTKAKLFKKKFWADNAVNGTSENIILPIGNNSCKT